MGNKKSTTVIPEYTIPRHHNGLKTNINLDEQSFNMVKAEWYQNKNSSQISKSKLISHESALLKKEPKHRLASNMRKLRIKQDQEHLVLHKKKIAKYKKKIFYRIESEKYHSNKDLGIFFKSSRLKFSNQLHTLIIRSSRAEEITPAFMIQLARSIQVQNLIDFRMNIESYLSRENFNNCLAPVFNNLKRNINLKTFYFLLHSDDYMHHVHISQAITAKEGKSLTNIFEKCKKIENLRLDFRLPDMECLAELVESISKLKLLKYLRVKASEFDIQSDWIYKMIDNYAKLKLLEKFILIIPGCESFTEKHSEYLGNMLKKLEKLRLFGFELNRSENFDVDPKFDLIINQLDKNVNYWIKYQDIDFLLQLS